MGLEDRLRRLENTLRNQVFAEPLPTIVIIEIMNREQAYLADRVLDKRHMEMAPDDDRNALRFHEYASCLADSQIPPEDRSAWETQIALSQQFPPLGRVGRL